MPQNKSNLFEKKFQQLKENSEIDLQKKYPGKKVEVRAVSNYRDPSTQANIVKKGSSTTDVSLHALNAAKDFQLFVDGKPIKNSKIYHEILWKNAEKLGLYHLDPKGFGAVDLGHIGVIEEDGVSTLGRLSDKYPEVKNTEEYKNLYSFLEKKINSGKYTPKEDTSFRQLQGERFEPRLWFTPMFDVEDNNSDNNIVEKNKKIKIEPLKVSKNKKFPIQHSTQLPLERFEPDINIVNSIDEKNITENINLQDSYTQNKDKVKDYSLYDLFNEEWKQKNIYSQVPKTDVVMLNTAKFGKIMKKEKGGIVKKKKKYAENGVTSDSPIKGNINFNPSNNPYENAYKPIPNYTTSQDQNSNIDNTQSSVQSDQIAPISTTQKKRKGINLSGSFNTADITAGVIAGANMIIPDFYKPEDNVNRMQRAYNPYPNGDGSQAIYKDGGKVKKNEPIYVDSPNDPRLQAYNDSLKLYNSYKELKDKLAQNKYVQVPTTKFDRLSEAQIIKEALRDKSKDTWVDKHINNPFISEAEKKRPWIEASREGNLYKTLDFYDGEINKDLGYQYFSTTIRPKSQETWRKHRYIGDGRLVYNYENVQPIQPVEYKPTPLPPSLVVNKTPPPKRKPVVPVPKPPIDTPQVNNQVPQKKIKYQYIREDSHGIRQTPIMDTMVQPEWFNPVNEDGTRKYKNGGMLYAYNGQHAANGLTLTNADRDAWEQMQADAYKMGFLGSDRSRTPGIEFIKSHGIDPAKLPLYQQDFQNLAQDDPSRISYSSEGLSDVDNFYGHKTAQQRYRKYEVQRNDETPIKFGTDANAASELTSLAKNDLSGFDERYKQEMSKVYNPDTGQYELPKAKSGIHIKPENRGKFNALKKRTGKTTEEALHSKDPHVRQMANFARNSKKWKHEDGGTVYAYDGDHYMENGGEIYAYTGDINYANGGNLYAYDGQPMADMGMSVENNAYSMISPFTGKLGGRKHTNGGTDIAFGGQIIEAEKDETFTKDKHGNLVILGNMKVPDTKITFKKAGKLLGEQEAYISKLQNKTTKALNNSKGMVVNNNILNTNNATVFEDAAKQRSKSVKLQKEALIEIQNNMLETADKLGIKPKKISDQLEAKMGKMMKKGYKCEDGKLIPKADPGFRFDLSSPVLTETPQAIPGVNTWNEYSIKGNLPKQEILPLPFANTLQPLPVSNPVMFPTEVTPYQPQMVNVPATPNPVFNSESFVDTDPKKPVSYTKYNKIGIPNILPEISVLADRPDPVTGQQFNPTLYTPYQVSYQDRRNEAQATFNALQRNLVNNPAAISNLAAQKYMQENAINAEEFRANQTIQNDIINKNVGILNDAERMNIALTDTQMDRQAKAKAITKDRKYQALASIANKFDQKRAENRNIQLIESMTNYRFNPKTGQVEYTGAPYQFVENSGMNSGSQNTRKYRYDADGNLLGWEEIDQSDNKDKVDASKAKKAAKSKFGGLFSK